MLSLITYVVLGCLIAIKGYSIALENGAAAVDNTLAQQPVRRLESMSEVAKGDDHIR